MKLAIALSALLLLSSSPTVAAVPNGSTCGDYSNLSFDLQEVCTGSTIAVLLEAVFTDTKPVTCNSNFSRDLRILTQTDTTRAARDYLDSLCAGALDIAAAASKTQDTEDWSAIQNAGVDLADFFDGKGFLNLETGNFHQDADDLSADAFYYTGTDPRENDHYPTSQESYTAGTAIDNFLSYPAEAVYLEDPTNLSSCGLQTVMCCWHRDRQYVDNNGSCRPGDCFDEDPADNTDLCWTEDDAGTPTAYPGDGVEGDMHCHGFAWSELQDDVNSHARWNNLFYVAMHDHMYSRGYVESITNDPNIANVQPMCGCIEDMSPVARSDCTEAIPVTNYTFTTDASEVISIAPVPDTYSIKFEACLGYIYDSTIGPEGYQDALDLEELTGKQNDLSAFLYRLYLEENMEYMVMDTIFKEQLVGYEDPNTNNNVAACAAAYEAKFPGEVYPIA